MTYLNHLLLNGYHLDVLKDCRLGIYCSYRLDVSVHSLIGDAGRLDYPEGAGKHTRMLDPGGLYELHSRLSGKLSASETTFIDCSF